MQEVAEELSVGKRKAATGGVRVTTEVSERPVEETVTLREEKVSAERKPADRELSPEEAEAAFKGKTVELLATSGEAEVSKRARVVGEVAVGKSVAEREETVKDTVRPQPRSRSRRSGPRRARAAEHRFATASAKPGTHVPGFSASRGVTT